MTSRSSAILPVLLAALLATTLAACGGDGGGSSPTAPENRTLALTSASVLVDGAPVSPNGTFHHNHGGTAGATRFEARLAQEGHPAPGYRVQVRFERPGGMMHRSGSFFLYDDGTHGDHVPGDGLYCLEDPDGIYGFHHMGARHGGYQYDFCGLYGDGAETNHRLFHVTVTD